jgi:hypothetical protein
MTKLFAETYPETDEGRATMALARVAEEIDGNLGSRMDAETRISVLVEMYRIERDDRRNRSTHVSGSALTVKAHHRIAPSEGVAAGRRT